MIKKYNHYDPRKLRFQRSGIGRALAAAIVATFLTNWLMPWHWLDTGIPLIGNLGPSINVAVFIIVFVLVRRWLRQFGYIS